LLRVLKILPPRAVDRITPSRLIDNPKDPAICAGRWPADQRERRGACFILICSPPFLGVRQFENERMTGGAATMMLRMPASATAEPRRGENRMKLSDVICFKLRNVICSTAWAAT